MKVWIVNPYGTLPSEGWREYRSSLLAKALAARGHKVTWWISDFEHRSKSYRNSGYIHDPLLPSDVRVISVHSSRYKKNISLGRIVYEISYGKEFERLALIEDSPDVLVMGDPSLFFCRYVLKYKNITGCKLILDVIDLWPELFIVALPNILKPIHRLIFYWLYKRRRNLVRLCDGLVAVSRDYLRIILKDQFKVPPNLVVYLGADVLAHNLISINQELNEELKLFKDKYSLIVVYAGTLGDAYDMEIIIAAVNQAKKRHLSIGFIVAGSGPQSHRFLEAAKSHASHLKFLGNLPSDYMRTIYANSDVGLLPYVADSTVAMPLKFYDYLAGGLAILSSLDRDVNEQITNHNLGLNYQPMEVSDLMEKLEWLVSNKEKVDAYKKNSKILSNSYDTQFQYQRYSEFVEEISLGRKS